MSICSTGLGKANPGAVTQLTADELDQLFTTDELDQLFKRVFGDQLLATIKQTGKVLNKGRSGIYDDLAARRLDAVKDGRSTRITVPSIRRYLAALPRAVVRPGHSKPGSPAVQQPTAPPPRAKSKKAAKAGGGRRQPD